MNIKQFSAFFGFCGLLLLSVSISHASPLGEKHGIQGIVFLDANEDGALNSQEQGLSNVVVKVVDTKDKVHAQTTTNSQGLYALDVASDENFRIEFVPPAQYVASHVGKDSQTQVVFVQSPAQVNLGLLPAAHETTFELGNRIWLDLDKNGVQDVDEWALPGVTVNLYQITRQSDKIKVTLVATTETDIWGQYLFNDKNLITKLDADASYEIRLDNADDYALGGALHGFSLTHLGAVSNDRLDSD